MRLTNFLVRDAIIPALSTTARDARDPAAVARVKEEVIREMVAALRDAGFFRGADVEDIVRAVLRRGERGDDRAGRHTPTPPPPPPPAGPPARRPAPDPAGLPR